MYFFFPLSVFQEEPSNLSSLYAETLVSVKTLTPRSGILLRNSVSQLSKKFPAISRNWVFIIAIARKYRMWRYFSVLRI